MSSEPFRWPIDLPRAQRQECLFYRTARESQELPPIRLSAEEIGLKARVTVFVGPEREGNGGEVVHQRDSVAVFREINRAEVKFAGVATFHANVGKLFGHIDGQLGFLLLAARGA